MNKPCFLVREAPNRATSDQACFLATMLLRRREQSTALAAPTYTRAPHFLSVPALAELLGPDVEKGLSLEQVADLQKKYRPNVLDVDGGISWLKILFRQVFNPMIMVRRLSLLFQPRLLVEPTAMRKANIACGSSTRPIRFAPPPL